MINKKVVLQISRGYFLKQPFMCGLKFGSQERTSSTRKPSSEDILFRFLAQEKI
ncbi:hypothetical protein Sjap_009659 [Stephania japonica]|uniref:Uncharacterized protein n=1 Tax=Stephania japonica TaxID=461633 RepID=A0AAP0P2Y2_9MAGN